MKQNHKALDAAMQHRLVQLALDMRQRAYVPYSHMAVGAALLSEDGQLFGGCNIENAAFSPTICAERCAVASAVAAGQRRFSAIAVAGGPQDLSEQLPQFFYPCGVCRQVLAEFCTPDFLVITVRSAADWQTLSLGELLAHSFGPAQME